MKKVLLLVSGLSVLAACDTPGQSAATGALIGAGIGAAAAGKDETGGAALGAAVGAIAGIAAHGAQEGKQCKFTYPDGTVTYGECPS